MKKFFTLFTLLFVSYWANLQAQTFQVASCSAPLGTNVYGPMNSIATANATSRIAVIYPASQLSGITGVPITNLYFNRITATGTMAGTPNFKVYFKTVVAADWGATSPDWAAEIATATLVYDGNPVSIVGSSAGWKNFPLLSNFNYSGTQNLAVFMEYTNSTASTTITWSYEYTAPCISTTNNNTSKYTNNTTGIMPATLTSSNYRRPLIGFDVLLTCGLPTGLTASNPTSSTADIAWTAPATAPANGYEYYYSTSNVVPTGATVPSGSTGAGVVSANLSGLSSGTYYYVYVRSNCGPSDKSPWTAAANFGTTPPNDECAVATNIVPQPYGATCTSNIVASTTGATQSATDPSCTSTANNDDIWYTFTASSTTQYLRYSGMVATIGTATQLAYALYDGACGATQLSCVTTVGSVGTGSAYLPGLTIGNVYSLRLWTTGAANAATFNFCLQDAPAALANDECANAISITQNATCTNTAGTTVGATESSAATPCTGTSDDDVWYSFEATSTDAQIVLSGVTAVIGTSTTLYYQVLSGSCGALISIMCNTGLTGIVGGLTPGETYYIRVYTSLATSMVNFNICVNEVAAAPTTCSSMSAPSTGLTIGGTPTFTWSATTNASSYELYLDANTPPSTLYATTYNNSGTSYAVTTALTPGVYYWYVLPLNSLGQPASCATIRSFTVVAPPSNDECSNAISLVASANATCTNTAGTTTGASQSNEAATTCSNTATGDDVWYSFVAVSTIHSVALSGTSNAAAVSIYSGACGSLTLLDCGTTNAFSTGLTVGATYYVRVYTTSTVYSTTTNFNICITTPPLNDECSGSIAIPVTTYGNACSFTAVNTTGATESTLTGQANTCSATGIDDDVWYSFTSALAGTYTFSYTALTATSGTASTVGMNIYTGTCGTLTEVASACSSGFGTGGTGSRTVVLAAGTTYTLRLSVGSSPNTGTFNFCITAPAPVPVNDECDGAIVVATQPYNAACVTSTSANSTGAGVSAITETSCSTTNDNDDIFYTFTATSSTQVLRFSNMLATLGTATTLGYHIFSGSCAGLTQLTSCSTGFGSAGAGSTMITGLTIGTVYYLRLFTGGTANSATFDFCIQDYLPAPSNDDCAGAISVATQPFNPTCVSSTTAITGGATASAITETSCTTTSDNDDIFYTFTATGTSQLLRFSNMVATFNTATTLGYQVFDACGGTQLTSCSTGFGSAGSGGTTITGLTAGNTYVLRLFTGGTDNAATFDFCIQDLAPQPANDECATAIAITAQPFSATCTASINATTNGSTASVITETSCITTSDNDDIFYTFIANSSSQILRFSNMVAGLGTATTLGYQVFTGACPGTQLTSCSTGFGTGGSGNTTITGLTAGTAYTLRLFAGGTANSASFDFCLQDMPATPANDECATAITISTQPYNTTCTGSTNANTNGATASTITETSCSTTSDNDDIFYSFIATGTSQLLSFSNMIAGIGTATQLGYHVFTGACPGTQLTSCSTAFGTAGAGSTVITGLTAGTVYTLRLFAGGTANSASFDFCLQDLPPVPSNDDCAGATVLTGGIPVNGNTLSATQSIAPEICGTSTATSAVDVWYQFTATTSGAALVTVSNVGIALDAVIQVYSGTCGAFTNIGCADGPGAGGTETVTLNGLVAGQTYYFRVYGFTAGAGPFTVTVSGAALPISFEYFKGSKQTSGNLLDWKLNCTGAAPATIVIERSQDARKFIPVNSMTATALRCLEAFNFTDITPAPGTNYYRLKSIDADGKIAYSNTIAILNKAKGFEIVNMMPNPVIGKAILNVASAGAATINIIVTDVAGRQIQSKTFNLLSGSNQLPLDFSKLSTGVYYLTGVTQGGERKTVKFIKD